MRNAGDKDIPDTLRTARIEALKRAIAEGRYHVNSAAIADAVIEEARVAIATRLGVH